MIANGLRHERVMKQHGGIYARCRAILFCALLIVPFCGDNTAQARSAKKKRHKKISSNAGKQIDSVSQEKESRTPAEQKIDSQLIYAIKKEQGDPALNGILQHMEIGVNVTAEGGTIVDITAEVTDALLSELRAGGATIVSAFPQHHALRVQIGLQQLEGIAALPEVTFIQPEQRAETWREDDRTGTSQADKFASQNARKGKPKRKTELQRTRQPRAQFSLRRACCSRRRPERNSR